MRALGAKAPLYIDAARDMRPSQIVGRARRLLPPRVLGAWTRPRATPEWRPNAGGIGAEREPQGGPAPPPEVTGEFAAVGASRVWGSPGFWTDPSDGLLYLFHLHDFAALATYAASQHSRSGDSFWAQVVESWLKSESRPRLPSWHPYPTSIRVISWAAALSSIEGWPDTLRSRMAAELWRQARYLRRSIEYDIGGNHVLKNATALVAAGAVFESSDLLGSGLGLLRRELARQILPDGGHEERSTSYHRQVRHDLEDAAELARRLTGSPPDWLLDALRRSTEWEMEMRGPDGVLPLLNDAWEGPPETERGTAPVTDLRDSGYVVLRDGDNQAIFDVGRICPPHLPPHAHADALSFVAWADGRQLVVDPGSYYYTGEWRDRFRGTAAHNTVEVDGRDQCQFWGDFRAAHQPRVLAQPLRRQGDVVVTAGAHDGYRRLAEPVTHHRSLVWCPGDGLVVVDVLRGRGRHEVRSSLHLAPDVLLDGTERAGPFRVAPLGVGANVSVRQGHYAPYLGRKVGATVLEDRRTVGPDIFFGWSLLRAGAEVSAIEGEQLMLTRRDGSSVAVPLELG